MGLWRAGRAEDKYWQKRNMCHPSQLRENIMIFKRRPPAEMQGKLFLSNKTHFPSLSAQNEAGDRVFRKVPVCLCYVMT